MARQVNGHLGTFPTISDLESKFPPAEFTGCSVNIGTTSPYHKAWSNGQTWSSAILESSDLNVFYTSPLALALRYAFPLATASFGSSTPDTTVGTARYPWRASTRYEKGAIRTNSGNIYTCTVAGTSASATGPTHGSSTATDGTVTWEYTSADPDRWIASTAYVVGDFVNNLGSLYRCTTAGTSAASGGPNANSTGIVDGTAQWSRVQQFFVDTRNGNDIYTIGTGQTPLTPTKTINPIIGANIKLWVAAGSTFNVSFTGSGSGLITALQPGATITVYDPTTGNEIRDQPNPYSRRLQGLWITEEEKATKYFKIQGDANNQSFSNITRTGGITIGTTNAATGLIRGAYITGCYYGIRIIQTTPVRIEDVLIEQAGSLTDATGQYHGASMRSEATSSNSGSSFARVGIKNDGVSEDGWWASGSDNMVNWTISDTAIWHKPNQTYNSNHADGLQFNRYPGVCTFKRVVVEHYLNSSDTIDDASEGVDQVGAAFITDTGGSSLASSVTMTDCVLVSNLLVLNTQPIDLALTRCVFATVKFDRTQVAYVNNINSGGVATQTDCINLLVNKNNPNDTVNSAVVPTKTRTFDITL